MQLNKIPKQYALSHLAGHLAAASQWDRLFQLVQDPNWEHWSTQEDYLGQLYVNDLQTAKKAALDLGWEGLAPIISVAMRVGNGAPISLSRMPPNGLASLVVQTPSLSEDIINHISNLRTGWDKIQCCFSVALMLEALGRPSQAETLMYEAFTALTQTISSYHLQPQKSFFIRALSRIMDDQLEQSARCITCIEVGRRLCRLGDHQAAWTLFTILIEKILPAFKSKPIFRTLKTE